MSLHTGARLGPYEVVGPIGAGGMGEVYRARDTRLDRAVAIKVLPSELGSDPEFRARFEREARAISQLQHPNICTLHDVGRHDDTDYLVLEYLEGETLAARLERGTLDPGAALTLAIQIAGALDAAHRAGIVHRDLKPGNVMLVRGATASAPSVAKLLDFGLAKPAGPSAGHAPGEAAPTRTTPITAQGAILGTFQYMAPEQLEGREADARSDIWAFGCLLYECLTGRRAFEGGSQASLIGAILKDQPAPVSSLAPVAPALLDRVVATCLAKDPDDRWQSAGDLGRELRWMHDAPRTPGASSEAAGSAGRRRPTAWLVWGAATAAIAAVTGFAAWSAARQSAPPAGAILQAVLPVSIDSAVEDAGFALSPDGRRLAYVTPDRQALMLRDLQTGETHVLAEGSQFTEPFFSPDSRQVGFVEGIRVAGRNAVSGNLGRVAVGGGAPVKILDGIVSLKGASWGDDDWIYYSPRPSDGLWRVRSTGGAPEQLTTPDASKGEKTHRRPFVLPGSKAVLFITGTSRITSFDDAAIEAISLGDRSRRRLIEGGMAPRYIAALGALVYSHGGDLIGVPFDPDSLAVTGPPVTLASGVDDEPLTGLSRYAVSHDGTFIWAPRSPAPLRAAVLAMDRQGRSAKIADAPYTITNGRLSPDGRRLAVDPDGATQQIAIIDLERNSTQRLTDEWDNIVPVWTPDGTHLIFRSNAGGGARNLYMRAADGSGTAERLTTSDEEHYIDDVFGRTVVYESYSPTTLSDLWTLSLDDRVPHVLLQTRFDENSARVSPNGHWIAYQSNQSGSWEISVQAVPSSGRQWQVSLGGGTQPEWLPGGLGLVYVNGSDVMSVTITASPAFAAGRPVKLFAMGPQDTLLDITSDGKFLVLRRDASPTPSSLGIIVNWFDQARRLISSPR